VLAAAISLVAISANAGNYKAKKGIGDTASSNEVINVIDEVILPN
jgi:hypothetical protein